MQKFLRKDEVKKASGFEANSTFHDAMNDGRFPPSPLAGEACPRASGRAAARGPGGWGEGFKRNACG